MDFQITKLISSTSRASQGPFRMLAESLYEKSQIKVTSFLNSVTFTRSGGLSPVNDKLDWHDATSEKINYISIFKKYSGTFI